MPYGPTATWAVIESTPSLRLTKYSMKMNHSSTSDVVLIIYWPFYLGGIARGKNLGEKRACVGVHDTTLTVISFLFSIFASWPGTDICRLGLVKLLTQLTLPQSDNMLVFHQTFLTFISPNPDTSKRYAVVGDMLTAQTCRFENARCHDSDPRAVSHSRATSRIWLISRVVG